MPSITSWMRLEPRPRDPAMTEGIEARVRDPLWMLARQWQSGEFRGEDAGSPIVADVAVSYATLSRYRPGGGDGGAVDYDPAALPLEPLVEREAVVPRAEPAGDGLDGARIALRAGVRFLDLLDAHGADARAYRAHYLDDFAFRAPAGTEGLDPATARFLAVVADRMLDARRLYPALLAALGPDLDGALPPDLLIDEADRPRVTAAALDWVAWYDACFSEPAADAAPWIPERLEYRFAVAAHDGERETVLEAREYPGGRLDWFAFDRVAGSLDSPARGRSTIRRTLVPAPVDFRGMPADRWWEFEDAQVNLGAVDAGATDLMRLVLLEFALVYGNDWFVVPIDLPPGVLARVDRLEVSDTFGERIDVPPAASLDGGGRPWRMFHLTAAPGATDDASPLFLPPVLAAGLESPPIEEVLLLRDEMANLAWAVERVVESPAGPPLRRYETFQSRRQRESEAAPAPADADAIAEARYRFATTAPDYWYPLVPVRPAPARRADRLRRGRLLLSAGTVQEEPRGRILEPGRPLSIHEEEVPRAGARVRRTAQLARWIGGSTHLWIGRAKRTGRGEGSSGLRYDAVELTKQEA